MATLRNHSHIIEFETKKSHGLNFNFNNLNRLSCHLNSKTVIKSDLLINHLDKFTFNLFFGWRLLFICIINDIQSSKFLFVWHILQIFAILFCIKTDFLLLSQWYAFSLFTIYLGWIFGCKIYQYTHKIQMCCFTAHTVQYLVYRSSVVLHTLCILPFFW